MTTANKHRSQTDGISEEVRIRRAFPDDLTVLERLAALDSQRALAGDILVAEINGIAVAALSLHSGRVVADPFVHTASVVHLLRVRASQAAATSAVKRLSRGLRPATAGA